MRKRVLSIIALTILVASILVGCSGASPTDSTLTILSITEGTVLVMKTGTDTWTEAEPGIALGVGDIIKTGDDSGAEITFFDGSTIELEAGTRLEITALDSSPDTDTKTITLMQTIGTTISRVTALLDPASTYAIETPSGVAAVRGSTMIVRIVFNDPNYEDGTILLTSLEGQIYWIGHGEELELAEGTQVIADSETTQIVQLSLAVDDSATTDEDTPVAVAAPGVLGNDSGLTVGDTLTVTAVDTIGTVGNVTAWAADGSFTYDPSGQFEALEAGNSTTDIFTYTVTDDYGITDTATVTITINGVYDPPDDNPPVYDPPDDNPPVYDPQVNHPPVAVDDSATTPQGTPVTIDILGNDSDPDGDALTLDSAGLAGNGTLTSNGSGIAYTPNPGFVGTDSFTYAISDGKGGSDTATVTVTVTPTQTPAYINIQINPGNGAIIYIYDATTDEWIAEEYYATPAQIEVVVGHYYHVWVEGNVTYDVGSNHLVEPSTFPLGGGGQQARGYAAASKTYSVHFTETPPS